MMNEKEKEIQEYLRKVIQLIGEDPDNPELEETPRRIADLLKDIRTGKDINIKDFFDRILPTKTDVMTVIKDIEFVSACPHHFWPYFGKVHIAIIPDKNIIGLSKYISAVRAMSRRLILQEEMADSLANAIMEKIKPLGCMVIVEGKHTCMLVGGKYDWGFPANTDAITVTSAVRGVFRHKEEPRMEALQLIYGNQRR